MDDTSRRMRNEFIYGSFRDVADCDYIAARVLHRLKLFDQFSWAALQAIEKYLKCILLIYDRDTRDIVHNLSKALKQVENIPDINWDFDDEIRKFLEYLTIYGGDRYFTFPRSTEGNELFLFDYSVWKIRRYCRDLYWMKVIQKQKGIKVYDIHIKSIQSKNCIKNANEFRLDPRGYLEKVLRQKRFAKQREQLIYKNAYYGSHKKHKIIFQRTITSATPAHYIFPDIYTWMKARIKLNKGVKEFFDANWENIN